MTGEGWPHVERARADVSVLAEHGLTPGGYALTVSNITPHKSSAVITHAVRGQAGRAIPIVAVGRRKMGGMFEQLDLRSPESLKLLRFVDDAMQRLRHENAAGLFFPSLFEGFGIPPLEAMAIGSPVIASDAAAIPEPCDPSSGPCSAACARKAASR